MANDCLVKTLKGTSGNNNLLMPGEMRCVLRTGRSSTSYANGYGITMNIISGSAKFSTNNSTTLSINGTEKTINPTEPSGVVQILNKYGLTKWKEYAWNYIVNIKDFKYCKRFTEISGWVSGDIRDLPYGSTGLLILSIGGSNQLFGNVEHLRNFDHTLNDLSIAGSFYGDISTIGNITKSLVVTSDGKSGDITGDITVFGTYSNLNTCRILGGHLTGDISNIGAVDNVVAMDGTFTWNGRTKDSNLPTIGFINGVDVKMKITNIDDAINDWATLTPSSTSNNKRIKVYGNRTSASDAAYATLQSSLTSIQIIPYSE